MSEAAIPFLVSAAAAAILAALIRWRCPDWSRRRVVLWSALPLPGAAAAISVLLMISSTAATEAECGVDACGMVMMAAFFVLLCAVGAFLLGTLVAMLIAGDRRPR